MKLCRIFDTVVIIINIKYFIMKKIKVLTIIAFFLTSLLLTSCHIMEPPCPAYADANQIEEQNV